MKVYIENVCVLPNHLHDFENITVQNKNIYLTDYGKIELFNNKANLFKLEKSDVEKSDNFLQDYNFYFSQEQWKKYKTMNHIPYHHVPIQLETKKYKLTDKLSYNIESINGEISDYYFDTTYTKEDFHLKDELNSFLIKYNNST